MNLQDFNTLAEAQAYTLPATIVRIEGAERKTAVETINIFNGTQDRLETFIPNPALTAEQQAQASLLARMIVKALKNLFNPEFYIQLENAQVQEAYAGALALGVLTQAEYDGILLAGTEEATTPFADSTQADFDMAKGVEEVLTLSGTGAQQVFTLLITTQPPKPISVKIQQRFGSDINNLTEWHDCGSFVGVNYTQQSYKSQVAASPAPYRELRAVSEITVGMSIV